MKVFNVTETQLYHFDTSQDFFEYINKNSEETIVITKEGKKISTFQEDEEVYFLISNEKKLYIIENHENETLKTTEIENKDFGTELSQHIEHLRRKEKYFKQVQRVFFKRFENCKKMKENQDNQYNALIALNFFVNSLKT